MQDFTNLAYGTNKNWRDIADQAATAAAIDADKTVLNADGGKQCRSRLLYLRNNQTGQVVRQQQFKLVTVKASGNVVTISPGKC